MAHVDADRPRAPHPRTSVLVRGAALAAIVLLLGFIASLGQVLRDEWRELKTERAAARANTLVGYPDIFPNPSLAQRPANWFHDEGEQTLLWSGWRNGTHDWFRVGRGDLSRDTISLPMGRDTIRAIDHPIVEVGGGVRWGRIPDEALVAGLNLNARQLAYPMTVLDKVLIVNDVVEGRPLLIAYLPFARPEAIVEVFDPIFAGQRLTMGSSGYFLDRRPVLYDRGSESLWVSQGDSLQAVAGHHKGVTLQRVARIVPMNWGDWRDKHPKGRLVVGADRSHPQPML